VGRRVASPAFVGRGEQLDALAAAPSRARERLARRAAFGLADEEEPAEAVGAAHRLGLIDRMAVR
jgi:hypothetical protein